MNRLKMRNVSAMVFATLVKPSDKNVDVSIVTKPHPSRIATASMMVVLAVPGGPECSQHTSIAQS